MKLVAVFFKILFKIPFFRNRYYGFYKRIFKPFRLFRGQTIICTYDKDLKIKADLDEWIQQHVYFLGTWMKQGTKFLKNQLKNGDVFIDIGANIGCYSLIASKLVGSNGMVHGFEPVSDVFRRFLFNIELNKLTNITANKKAVYETSGILEFFVSAQENAGMSSIFHHDTESGEIQKVEAITIDEYVEKMNIQRIDLIKIDIEGAELFALRGMKNTIKQFNPIIILEISEDAMQNSPVKEREVPDFLKDMNYEMKGIDKKGKLVDLSQSFSGYTNYVFCPVKK